MLVLLLLGALPWTVVFSPGAITLIFPFGLALLDPFSFVALPELLARGGGLPRMPWLLPASALMYVGALTGAAVRLLGWGDDRLPGYLLVFASLAHLGVSYAFLHRPGYLPLPIGPIAGLAVAWWCDGEALVADLRGSRNDRPE